MIPNMSGADAHESSVRHGGALELRFLAWAFWHSAYNTQAALTAQPWVQAALNQGAPRFSDWLERLPLRAGQTQLALVPPYEKWALEVLTHADYDDYWKHPSLDFRRHWDRVPGMPILFVGGCTTPTRVPRSRTSPGWAPAAAGRCAPWWVRGRTGPGPWSSPTRATWSSATRPPCPASTSCTCAGTTAGCAGWTTAWTAKPRCASS